MSTAPKTPRPILTEKSKKVLIHVLVFLSGLLAGVVGAPFAPLIKVGTDVAVEAIEQAPVREEKAAPAPEAPAPVADPVEMPEAPAPAEETPAALPAQMPTE